jgi:hypothetical protein
MSRVLDFNDSQSSATIPIIEGTVAFKQYADTAAYIADVGAPQGGAAFYNTTLDVIQYYDDAVSDWQIVGQRGKITGTRGVPIAVSVAGITPGGYESETIYVAGDGGAIDITANPQIAAGNNDGDELILIGTSDANTLQFDDGNGLSLNGAMVLYNNSVLKLKWDGTTWLEISRRD